MSGVVPDGPIVVYDDDNFYMGSLLVEALKNKGCEVSYVTPAASVAAWTVHTLEQRSIIAKLKALKVPIFVNSTLADFSGDSLEILSTYALNGPIEIPCNNLVFVGAKLPHKDLLDSAK